MIDDTRGREYYAVLPNLMSLKNRGIAQSGSALALGARCREFKSLYPDQFGSTPSSLSHGVLAFRRNPFLRLALEIGSLEDARVLQLTHLAPDHDQW